MDAETMKELGIEEIVSFEPLIRNVTISHDAQRRLITDLQLFALWQHTNGDKLYNKKEAAKLQKQLRHRYNIHKQRQTQKRLEKRQKAQKEYLELCRSIAETVFTVEVLGKDVEPTGEVDWDTPIKDEVTGSKVGTPRSLFNGIDSPIVLDWDMRPFDAREKSQLDGYLNKLMKYDGFSYPFSFAREDLDGGQPIRLIKEKLPFGQEPEPFFSFQLRLSYRPRTREIRKKITKIFKSD